MQTNRQEQQQEPMQTYVTPASGDLAAVPILNPPDSAASQAAQINAYLDAVCKQMPAEVPGGALENMRLEMHGHLEAAIVAYCELGETEAEATQSALIQFGPPKTVARQWQQEWTETLSETKGVSVRPSLQVALKTWAAVDISALGLVMAYLPIQMTHNITELQMFTLGLMTFTVLLGLPLLAGVMVGLRARRRPLLCTMGGNLLLLPLLTVGWTGVNHWSHYYTSWVTGKSYLAPISREFSDAVQSVIAFLPTWIIFSLLGCSLVLIGHHIRKHIRRRQIAR